MDPSSEYEVCMAIVQIVVVILVILLSCLIYRNRQDELRGMRVGQPYWHTGEALRKTVSDFHLRFARVPRRLDEVRAEHTALIEKLLSHLRDQGIEVHPEYVGSAYEGVKVTKSERNDDLEFDILVTMKLPNGWEAQAEYVPDLAGHVFLSLLKGYAPGQNMTFFDNIVTVEMSSWGHTRFFLDGRKIIYKFFGELQKWIDASEDIKERILLRRHGSAVQMDVYEQKISSDRPHYTVDVVPALKIEVARKVLLYVAKPVKSRIMPDPAAWRLLSSTDTEFSGRYNDERVDRIISTHLKFMLELEQHLKYCTRIVSFAGYKVGKNDNNLEFKVLVIDESRKNQIEVSQIRDKPDLFRLNLGIGQTSERLNSRKETTTFITILQQFIVSNRLLNGKVHIRRDGPIVRLIVCESDEETSSAESIHNKPLYYVDLILAYEVDGRLYVARPNEDWYTNEMENSKAWRLSYSTEAKDAMRGPYGCLKMVFRILKVLRNREAALAPLTSYHLKTVLLWLIRERHSSTWNERYLGERLIDALLRLEKYLKDKNLPHYFLTGVNLTSHMVEDCINSMRWRIHALCTNEQEMMRVLRATN